MPLNGIISVTSFDTGLILCIEIMRKCSFVCYTKSTSNISVKIIMKEELVEWMVLV